VDAPTPSTSGTEVAFQPFAFAGAVGISVLIGGTSSLFGPLLTSFAQRFHLSLPSAGVALSVYFVGAGFGVLPGWLGLKRLEGRIVLIISLITIALGALTGAATHTWILFLISVFLVGLGFGGIDIGMNTLLARTALDGRAFRLSMGNAGFGVGAVICPLIIVLIRPGNFPFVLTGIGILAFVLSTFVGGVHAPPLRAEARQRRITGMKEQRRPILVTFVIAYVVYIAVETSAAGWMATQLHGEGFSQSAGSYVTAGFWCGLAIGRALGGPLYHRLSDRILVLGGLVLATLACLLALSTTLAPFAYPALGLIIASVFPMGLMWYSMLCPHDSDGISWIILFMMVGGVIGPGTLDLMVGGFGIHVVPLTIAIFAGIDLLVFTSALRFRPLIVD